MVDRVHSLWTTMQIKETTTMKTTDFRTFPENTPSEDRRYACWDRRSPVIVLLRWATGQWWERSGDCLQVRTSVTGHVTHFHPAVLPTERPREEYADGAQHYCQRCTTSEPCVFTHRRRSHDWSHRGVSVDSADMHRIGDPVAPEGAVPELVGAIDAFLDESKTRTRQSMRNVADKYRGEG